jgi:hypothetical protein
MVVLRLPPYEGRGGKSAFTREDPAVFGDAD